MKHYALLTREAISVVHNQTLNRRNRRNIRLGYTAYNCVPRSHLCEAIKTKPKTGGLTDLKYYALLTRGAIFGSSLASPQTSFGVRLSHIHKRTPKDVCGEASSSLNLRKKKQKRNIRQGCVTPHKRYVK